MSVKSCSKAIFAQITNQVDMRILRIISAWKKSLERRLPSSEVGTGH